MDTTETSDVRYIRGRSVMHTPISSTCSIMAKSLTVCVPASTTTSVIVQRDDNAILIDFGGGATTDWGDKENQTYCGGGRVTNGFWTS